MPLIKRLGMSPQRVVPPIPYPWPIERLMQAPEVFPCDDSQIESAGSIRKLFYSGLPYRGKPTRVFAYYGAPSRPIADPCPAMVLVHGGGGTAFTHWVELWNERGFHAIAMDTCGCVPVGEYGNWNSHDYGGPRGWDDFENVDKPIDEQWPYYAVASVVAGHSLLRTMPGVDPGRIGITGISWGGYLTCHAIGVDPRLAFAVPVYGCGHLDIESAWTPNFDQLGPERAARWLDLWDPKWSLAASSQPIHWVNGTNDFAYPMCAWQASYRTAPGPRSLTNIVRMGHAHFGPGENPAEIHAYALRRCGLGPEMARVTGAGEEGGTAHVAWANGGSEVATVQFNYTADAGPWAERNWEIADVPFDSSASRAKARVPDGATAYYFNLLDANGLIISSEHVSCA